MKRKDWVLVVLLVVFVWLTALFLMYTKDSFYEGAFEQAGVLDKLGNETVHAFHPAILGFLSIQTFHYQFPNLLEEQLSSSEKSHLIDVKRLLDFLRVFYGITLLISIIWIAVLVKKKNIQKLAQILHHAGIASMAFLIVAFLGSLFFSSFFTVFHWVFFPQGNYSFPATSLLIQLYPETLFLKAFEIILGLVLIQGVSLWLLSYGLKKT